MIRKNFPFVDSQLFENAFYMEDSKYLELVPYILSNEWISVVDPFDKSESTFMENADKWGGCVAFHIEMKPPVKGGTLWNFEKKHTTFRGMRSQDSTKRVELSDRRCVLIDDPNQGGIRSPVCSIVMVLNDTYKKYKNKPVIYIRRKLKIESA